MSRRPVLAGPLPHPIAHRGSRVLWPENTLIAFAGAVGLGYRWVETDLHLTRDGVVVCLHDHTLDRTTDGRGPVWELDHERVRELDAGARHGPRRPYRGRGISVPSLEEVVLAFPDLRLVAELKQDGLEEPLASLVERLDLWDRLVVGSFSDTRLAAFREMTHGRVATSAGREETRRVLAAVRANDDPPLLADALQVPQWYRGTRLVTPTTVSRLHRVGYQVHVWTVNRTYEMRRLVAWGVDGIITDRPDLLRRVLLRLGRWTGG